MTISVWLRKKLLLALSSIPFILIFAFIIFMYINIIYTIAACHKRVEVQQYYERDEMIRTLTNNLSKINVVGDRGNFSRQIERD